jgi:hypothetical protein
VTAISVSDTDIGRALDWTLSRQRGRYLIAVACLALVVVSSITVAKPHVGHRALWTSAPSVILCWVVAGFVTLHVGRRASVGW